MKRLGLSGSTLKLLACVFMLCDHIGSRLLPSYRVLRIIGRLAFPIFAFCIAEGCRYTRHKGKHMALIVGFGAAWEALLISYYKEWDGNIFLTFSLLILLIYLWQWVKKQWCSCSAWVGCALFVLYSAAVIGAWFLTETVHFEYGFWGVMAAPAVAMFDYQDAQAPSWMKRFDHVAVKLLMLSAVLFFLALPTIERGVQIYALLALPVLVFYNGKAGERRLKYLFYVFYPLHLIVIECIRVYGR